MPAERGDHLACQRPGARCSPISEARDARRKADAGQLGPLAVPEHPNFGRACGVLFWILVIKTASRAPTAPQPTPARCACAHFLALPLRVGGEASHARTQARPLCSSEHVEACVRSPVDEGLLPLSVVGSTLSNLFPRLCGPMQPSADFPQAGMACASSLRLCRPRLSVSSRCVIALVSLLPRPPPRPPPRPLPRPCASRGAGGRSGSPFTRRSWRSAPMSTAI